MSHGPNDDKQRCPACGSAERKLVWTRTDWPDAVTRKSGYVQVCRSCLPRLRRYTLIFRRCDRKLRRTTFAIVLGYVLRGAFKL